MNLYSNYQNNTTKKQEQPSISCQKHIIYDCEYINWQNKESQPFFVCSDCIKENNLDQSKLLEIQSFFSNSQSNQIFQNQQQVNINKKMEELLSDKKFTDFSLENNIDQITCMFDNFKQSVLNCIEIQRGLILRHVQLIENIRQESIKQYKSLRGGSRLNKQSNKHSIKITQDLKTMENQIKANISEQQSEMLSNQKSLEENIDRFYEYEKANNLIEESSIDNFYQYLKVNTSPKLINHQATKEDPTLSWYQQIEENPTASGENYSKLEIIKTSYYNSQNNMKIRKLENGYIDLINDSEQSIARQVYINEEIQFDKKYEIILGISPQQHELLGLFMGLLPFSMKDQAGHLSQLTLYTDGQSQGIGYIIMGQHCHQYLKDLREVKFRIHLKQSMLQCYTKVKGEHNILYKASGWESVTRDERYFFYISSINSYAQVTIKTFQEIEGEFDNWF